MNNRSAMFAQAVRGPVLLMVLGALFALQQIGVVAFSRSWPLLIIAVGVLKLLERTATNRTSYLNQSLASPSTTPNFAPPQADFLASQPQSAIRATRYSDFRARGAATVQLNNAQPGERAGAPRR